MRDGYAWITANIAYQSPLDPVNFDREAIKSDLNEIPELVVSQVKVVNRNWLSYFKEADVWFEVTDDNLTESEVRDKMLDKVKSGNRAREAVRRFKLAPAGDIPDGQVPSGVHDGNGSMPWKSILVTALAVGFAFGLIEVVRGN